MLQLVTLFCIFSPTDDLDMYMVTAVAGGVMSLTTQAVSGTVYSTDTYLTLYDASSAVLASNDDGGEVDTFFY